MLSCVFTYSRINLIMMLNDLEMSLFLTDTRILPLYPFELPTCYDLPEITRDGLHLTLQKFN